MWDIYRSKYGEDPVNKVFLGHDQVLIINEAIKLGGGATAAQVLAGLPQVKDLQGTTGVLTLSPETHQPVGLSMVMFKIEKGEYLDLGRYVPEKHKK